MYTDTDYLAWRERHKDLEREAAHERLISTLQLGQKNRLNLIQRLSRWVNHQKTTAFSASAPEVSGEPLFRL